MYKTEGEMQTRAVKFTAIAQKRQDYYNIA